MCFGATCSFARRTSCPSCGGPGPAAASDQIMTFLTERLADPCTTS
jgi:hypothetical protein